MSCNWDRPTATKAEFWVVHLHRNLGFFSTYKLINKKRALTNSNGSVPSAGFRAGAHVPDENDTFRTDTAPDRTTSLPLTSANTNAGTAPSHMLTARMSRSACQAGTVRNASEDAALCRQFSPNSLIAIFDIAPSQNCRGLNHSKASGILELFGKHTRR